MCDKMHVFEDVSQLMAVSVYMCVDTCINTSGIYVGGWVSSE